MQAVGAVTLHGCTGGTGDRLPIITLGKEENSLILIQRQVYLNTSGQAELFALSTARGNVLLHEMDDHPSVVRELEETNYFSFRAVSAIQTSTPPLADILREFNPHVLLLENQLAALPAQRSYVRAADHVTVFFGALNRGADWALLMGALNEVIRAHGERLSFLVTGDRAFYDELRTPRKEFIWGEKDGDPVASYADYTAALHRADIALLPLGDTAFNRTKSDLKFIEAAGHGAAALASPTVYARTLCDGETGLIYGDVRDFVEKLTLLVTNDDLRIRLAENAYRYVAAHRLITQHVESYIAAYRDLFARREELERDRWARMERYFTDLLP
ncbi:glycosyltransferase [Selenomonas artemidis]|jgi:glycosyltransferase|nr:glycosyltransferase [Selenomonas artemidis]